MKHSWNHKVSSNKHGVAQCVKCGMIKEYVSGYPTYFIGDTVRDKKAPKCKGRPVEIV